MMLVLPLLMAATIAPAMQVADASTRYAKEAVRICVDTRSEPAAVRQLAAAEGWVDAGLAALPYPSEITVGGTPNVTYRPSNVWTIDQNGQLFTVILYDFPRGHKSRHCEVAAWDLDAGVVDKALKADGRIFGGFQERPGFPMRRYEVKKPRTFFRYGSAAKDSRTLHVLTAH